MPPLPTSGAPTTGAVAIIYWGLLGLAIVIAVSRYFLPSGKQRLEFRQSKETDAIRVLQNQIESLQKEVQDLKTAVEKMTRHEERNREYRHVLANQVQAFLFGYDSTRGLLFEVRDEWQAMPVHFKKRIEGLKTSDEILRKYPEPVHDKDE